jgi:predicted ATPase
MLILLGEALLQRQSPTIYLADEPELSLHIEWQESLVDNILDMNPNAQIFFATHSPDIVGRFDGGVRQMKSLF